LNPLTQSINCLRLIAFGIEFGNELKSIHFIMILQQRRGWWKVLVGSSELENSQDSELTLAFWRGFRFGYLQLQRESSLNNEVEKETERKDLNRPSQVRDASSTLIEKN